MTERSLMGTGRRDMQNGDLGEQSVMDDLR